MAKAKCIAIVEFGRINLIIQKNEKGYSQFAKVLHNIEKEGCMSWYGDVRNDNGDEQCGWIITPKATMEEAKI